MANIKIIIQTLEDAKKSPLAMPDLTDDNSLDGSAFTVCFLEDVQGDTKAGIIFAIEDIDGFTFTYSITEDNFERVIHQFKATLQLFFELRVKRIAGQN